MQRSTSERRGLLAVLQKSTRPLTAAEIKKALGASTHTATVYRALDHFVHSGEVRRVELGGRAAHYELEREHHHHIVCTSCGDIEDVRWEPRDLESRVLKESKKFRAIGSHSLEFFGICNRCC